MRKIALILTALTATFALPALAQSRPTISIPHLLPANPLSPTPTTVGTAAAAAANPTPEQVVKNLQALTKADAAYAIALAQQANTPASNVRAQCWQAIQSALPVAPTGVTEPPNPHLITNVEQLAELIDGLQPGSPLFVNCAGAAELAKMSVLNFVNAIVTGAAGIAVLAPKL